MIRPIVSFARLFTSGSNHSQTRSPGRMARRQTRRYSHSQQSLESRILLSAYVVDTTADVIANDGFTSLREAVLASSTNVAVGDAVAGSVNGDTVHFDEAVFTPGTTINLTLGELDILDDVTINAIRGNVIIDANNSSRIFDVTTNENVTLNGLTLREGNAGAGNGGAILKNGTGTLSVTNSSFIANRAGMGAGIAAQAGTINIRSSTLNDGVATVSAGAVLLAAGTSSQIENTTFADNVAQGVALNDGAGAIYNDGGNLNIQSSVLTGNRATGALGSGGAIFANGGNTTINDSRLSTNAASRAGGAIEVADSAFVVINDSTLGGTMTTQGNRAGTVPGNGGALHITGAGSDVRINGGSVRNNIATREGGGLWNDAGSFLRVNGVTVSNNTAQGDAGDDGGGAIFNNGGTTVIIDSIMDGNRATGTLGSGGAVFALGGTTTINDSRLSANVANRAGGAIEVADAGFVTVNNTALGGAMTSQGNRAGTNPGNGGALHITGGGSDVRINGGSIRNNTATREGGGLWNDAGSFLRISDVTIADNTANGSAADDGGGGIFNNGGNTVIIDSRLNGNRATGAAGSGGAIFAFGGSTTINNTVFTTNSARRAGGAIEVAAAGELTMNSSFIGGTTASLGNFAGGNPGNGGGLHITGAGSDVVLNGGTVQNNVATREGGGLWNDAGSFLTLNRVTVADNVARGVNADDGGGGIFNNGGDTLIDESTLRNNRATGRFGAGGGVHSNGGEVVIKNSTLYHNHANAGGAIANLGGEMDVVNTTISTNTARTGAGIANYSDLDITNATIVLNEADFAGGIYAFTGSNTLMNNSIVAGNKGSEDSNDDIGGRINLASAFNIIGDSRSAGGLRHNVNGNQLGHNGKGDLRIGKIIDKDLEDNGGPTWTHELDDDGPAVNAGSNALAVDENGVPLNRDQRGFQRIFGGRVDIGAFELIDFNGDNDDDYGNGKGA